MAKKTSEFGKGFIYNLILFSKHWWKHSDYLEKYQGIKGIIDDGSEMWFNGASDHLYELEIPEQWKRKKIGKLAKWIQDKGLYWGHRFEKKPTKKDFNEMFEKIEELAMLIDKELGIKPIQADWN